MARKRPTASSSQQPAPTWFGGIEAEPHDAGRAVALTPRAASVLVC